MEDEKGSSRAPACIDWSVEEVADWIERLGYKEYRDCFITNAVCGRKMIWVSASTLPSIGVTDWKHIQHIAGAVRKELGLEEPFWNRSITKPHWSQLGMFLEAKSFTGARADRLKFEPNRTS